MKRLLPWLALLTLAAPAQPPQKIVIGAWNIEHLGDPARRSEPSRNVAQQPEDLARYISQSGADILALEEIGDNPNTEFDPDNPTLAKALALLSKDWKYILFPKKGDELTQLTGIAWNSAKVSAVDGPYILPINDRTNDGFQLWKRWPQAMKFRVAQGQTDFVLIPMHLKANRRDDPNDNPARQRAQETRALVQVLGSVRQRFREQDVILLGDTNCLKASEPALRNLSRAGYRDLNAKDMRTTWEGPAPFDRILVPRRQPEFRNSSETVHRPAGMDAKDFKIKYSDHYLVTTEMQVGPDDD
ncbi:endonuclease/exonuclease/phosphatase family protein [bacterium]|nr:endonuclease/exonuclease/phosphatase family protein [bacterium]